MSSESERKPTEIKQQPAEQPESKKFAVAHKTYETISNQEFMAIHKTLLAVQGQLSHPEFGFVRYLLEMTIKEFIMPGEAHEPLSGESKTARLPDQNP